MALIHELSSLLEQAMTVNHALRKTIEQKDFCLATLLSNAPPSLAISQTVDNNKVVGVDEGYEEDTYPQEEHRDYQFLEYLALRDVDAVVDSTEDIPCPEEDRSLEYTEYMTQRREMEDPIVTLPEIGKQVNKVSAFLARVVGIAKGSGKDSVTLGMWHNHWQKRPYGKGALCNEVDLIPSVSHPDLRWKVSGPLSGQIWSLESMPIQHPEMGGASDSKDFGYGPEDTRPAKKLEVAKFMDVRGLPYVDFELYIHLKRYTMENGTVASTYSKLHRLAKTYLATYRLNHLSSELLLEVQHWTVLAAMIPSLSEMRGIKMMAQSEIYRNMGKSAQFKRDGKVVEEKKWWHFRAPRLLEMYKPVPT